MDSQSLAPELPVVRKPKRRKKKYQALINNFFTPAFFVAVNIYYEIIFHVYYCKDANILLPLLVCVPTGILAGIICDLFPEKVTRVLRYVYTASQFLLFGVQIVYSNIFKDVMSWSLAGLAPQVAKNFMRETFISIWETLYLLLLMALAFVALALLVKKFNPVSTPNRYKTILVLIVLVLTLIIAFVSIVIPGKKAHSPYDIIFKNWDLDLSMRKMGVISSTWLDFKSMIFPADVEDVPVIVDPTQFTDPPQTDGPGHAGESGNGSESGEQPVIDDNPYNTIEELDFSAIAAKSDNDMVKSLCDYFTALNPTKKNQYTGMFKGYNLIMFCAESFSPVAVREDLTPTLYKLVNSGFVFDNYWISYSSVTTNGEYSFLTGLFPDFAKPKADGSFLYSANNTMNMTMASWFRNQGIQPLAYHPNYVYYYNRNVTHPNLGYTIRGRENYDNLTGWPESDLTLMEDVTGEFINGNRFLVHVMTVSGHHNYTFAVTNGDATNEMAVKNKPLVENLDWSLFAKDQKYEEVAKAYVACNIELDRALEHLIKELEKAGELDRTVICLSTDHYPYGLTDEEYASMLGYKSRYGLKYDGMERYRSNLILWNSAMETVHVSKPCCSVDVLPTLLNLFGMEYDSRLYSGQDILSDSYGLAILKDQSFITDKIVYNARYGKTYNLDKSWTMPDGYLDAYIQVVKNRFSVASNILNNDFYALLPKDVITASQSKQ